jgi:hypothetical protein
MAARQQLQKTLHSHIAGGKHPAAGFTCSGWVHDTTSVGLIKQ